jgi:small glutamine-rich tetratricopeptide repeat-containing protein alpha
MEEVKLNLVKNIIEFLSTSSKDGSVSGEGAESLEVAIQCIGDAFGLNLEDEEIKKAIDAKQGTLLKVFGVFHNTQKKATGAKQVSIN